MNRWIKRTLVGGAAAAVLLGGFAAWAHRDGGHGWHRGATNEAEAVEMQARMVDRVAGRLDLDAAQKARLALLGNTLRAQRSALMGSTDPRAELQALVAGPSFDRARAGALLSNKIAALQSGAPALVTAMADFYDGLNPKQQTQLREFMASRGGHHGHGQGGERHGMQGGDGGQAHDHGERHARLGRSDASRD